MDGNKLADKKKSNKTTVSFQIDAELYHMYKRILLEKHTKTTSDLVSYIKKTVEEEGFILDEPGIQRPTSEELEYMLDPNVQEDEKIR